MLKSIKTTNYSLNNKTWRHCHSCCCHFVYDWRIVDYQHKLRR